ncbi:MAG: hypothetical protein JXA03_16345 [Bacteroidales bacterium]|nr:hypothetical protein [Bacteroidales bacterium]
MNFLKLFLISAAVILYGNLHSQSDLAGMLIKVADFHKVEKYRDAISICDSAIHYWPEIAELYHLRGVTHFYLDEYSEAIADFNTVVYLKPGFAEAYLFRSKAKARKGNIIGAIRDLNNARSENFYKTLFTLGDDMLQSLFSGSSEKDKKDGDMDAPVQ